MKKTTLKQFFGKHPYLKKSLFSELGDIERTRVSEMINGKLKPNEGQIKEFNEALQQLGKQLMNTILTGEN